MDVSIFDLFASATAFTLAIVLASLNMPGGEQWQSMRRMNKLLIVCYSVMGISNLVTCLLGVDEAADPVTMGAMLVISMYQAMLFTATCVVFASPRTITAGWLTTNGLGIMAVSIAIIYAVCMGGHLVDAGLWLGIAVYVALLVYYCLLFHTCYRRSLQQLEESYDEDMRGSLRLVKRCFLGALTVGLSALLYVVLRMGELWYNIFTCIYTLYYIYLVICVINYRIEAGYIVKVVASHNMEIEPELSAITIGNDAEKRLSDAIDRWVESKQYVRSDQTVEEIAAELGTTHAVLKSYFANRVHTPFRTWRQDLRLEEAKRLLREKEVSTSIVHTMVGISDKSNFYKIFCKQVGMTPQEYASQFE